MGLYGAGDERIGDAGGILTHATFDPQDGTASHVAPATRLAPCVGSRGGGRGMRTREASSVVVFVFVFVFALVLLLDRIE